MNKSKKIAAIIAGVMAGILLLSMILGLLATTVRAAGESSSALREQINELKDEKAEITAQLRELESQRKKNFNDIRDIVAEKDNLDQQVGLLMQQIVATNQLISAYNLLIADKQEEVDDAQENLDSLYNLYRERIRAMEEEGELSYWEVLFEASSFFEFLDRWNMIEEIREADQRSLEQLNEAAKELESATSLLATEKSDLQVVQVGLQATQQDLEAKQTQAGVLLGQLIEKDEEFQAMIDYSEQLQEDVMQQIAKTEDKFDKAKYSEWLATSVPPTTHPGGPGKTVDGVTWYLPTKNYRITSAFGWRTHPIHGDRRHHNGIDMAAAQGTPIYATRAGVVTVTDYQAGGAGYYVKINHGDGFISVYMHMTHYTVKEGDFVKAGQKIGEVGSTGGSTGPHLHFGIALNGTYVNPLKYIDA